MRQNVGEGHRCDDDQDDRGRLRILKAADVLPEDHADAASADDAPYRDLDRAFGLQEAREIGAEPFRGAVRPIATGL